MMALLKDIKLDMYPKATLSWKESILLTLSPVAKLTIVRLLLTIAATKNCIYTNMILIMHFYMEILMKRYTWILLQDSKSPNQVKYAG